jgi:SHS2 domain-containing protein
MSSWLFPTTADVGMRVFGSSLANLLQEAAYGMQTYLLSSESNHSVDALLRHTGEWRVRAQHQPHDPAYLFLAWLDEVLYRAEVHQQWLVDTVIRVNEDDTGLEAVIQASWVSAGEVEREIEIKAVTTHRLVVREVMESEMIASEWEDVPSFEGPGWYADVVFDI